MSDTQFSFANLPSEKVLEMCEKSRTSIKKWIDKNLEEHITSLMNRRFFRCKTREKAIETLKKPDGFFGFSKWDQLQCPYDTGDRLRRISRIERLAKLAPTVSIGASDTDLF